MEKTNASLSWVEISNFYHGSLFGYIVCFYPCDTIINVCVCITADAYDMCR